MYFKKRPTVIIALAVLMFVSGLCWYKWFNNKMARVDAGTARPDFPYSDYSQEELEKLYPQYVENNVATVQTPEETHRKFVEALKKGDFEEATNCCFREGDRVEMKTGLKQIQEDKLLLKMVNDLDTSLNKISMDSNRSAYSYMTVKDGKNYGHRINFIKTSQGIWLIESL